MATFEPMYGSVKMAQFTMVGPHRAANLESTRHWLGAPYRKRKSNGTWV